MTRLTGSKVAELKTWLDPPQWQSAYEAARSKRYPGTASWIISSSYYRDWRARIEDGRNICSQSSNSTAAAIGRILAVQAKPGYGKTVLCSTVIEDCAKDHVRSNGSNLKQVTTLEQASTAFYFFEKQALGDSNVESAFRAITAQLLHIHQGDRVTIDTALLMKYNQGCGQVTASAAEVRDLLSLFLHQSPETTLIFDGVDECDEYLWFAEHLNEIVTGTSCRIFLSCRPTVSIDGYFEGFESTTLLLNHEENAQDIVSYVEPKINGLISTSKLDQSDSLQEIVAKICQRSRSMFLWASLMITYLESDFLSPEDRHEAIVELNMFDDLDALYIRILQNIRRQCKGGKAWTNVQRMFQWVTVAHRPLQLSELRTALAIETGKPVSQRRCLPNFEKTIPKMSGALMEISRDGTVRFIHLSVLEFLTRATKPYEDVLQGDISLLMIESEAANCVLASRCLSYLMHTMPGQSLSGSRRQAMDPQALLKKFPLSLYTTQYWALHASKGLESPQYMSSNASNFRQELLDMISCFLSNKRAVTVWTEASWTFGAAPELHSLSSQAGQMFAMFAQDVAHMNKQWGPTLLSAPYEIWETSIPAFMNSPFWVGTDSARVSVLGTNIDALPNDHGADVQNDFMTIASRTSADRTEVGIIKIWPSRLFTELKTLTAADVSICSKGWYMNYTIVSTANEKNVLSMTFELPDDNVFIALRRACRSKRAKEFSFPVDFSDDLRQIAILRCVVRVLSTNDSSTNAQYTFHSQNILDGPPAICPPSELEMSLFYRDISRPDHQEHTQDWYQTKFFVKCKYLLTLSGCKAPLSTDTFYDQWRLTIHGDDSQWTDQPEFRHLATQITTLSSFVSPHYVFHPFEPVLAISRLGNVMLWFFKEQPARTISVFREPLDNLHFSACGNFLYGDVVEQPLNRQSGDATACITIPFTSRIGDTVVKLQPVYLHEDEAKSRFGQQLAHGSDTEATSLGEIDAAALLTTPLESSLATITHPGHFKVSILKHKPNDSDTPGSSSITLHRAHNSSLAGELHLIHLPGALDFKSSSGTLLTKDFSSHFGNTDRPAFGLVINKSAQEAYSINEESDVQLPILVTRTLESLSKPVMKRPLQSICDSSTPPSKKRGVEVSPDQMLDVKSLPLPQDGMS
ncbi:Nn.00g038990.m01.CDS01 [Neocucurbitaria sp. VM-36]